MKEIEQIVRRAADPSSTLAARREAFGELVIRFQDMAFGCAFAVLGDVYLAQDTAQEAFVVAWQKLAQLREPAAFPGWFKRIVLTQCNRLTRCKRLQIVPLEEGVNASTIDPGPQASAERHDLLAKVLQAINALPENERLVTTLFLFKNDLQQQRPSRDTNFSNTVNTKLRPFHDPDWSTVSAIASIRSG